MQLSCDKCGMMCDGLHMDHKSRMWVCDYCRMAKNPATGYIVVHPKDLYYGGFYSLESRKMDYFTTLRQLINCGWFVRKITQKANDEECLIQLEYYGRLRCPRISPSYTKMPYLAKDCRNHNCARGGLIA